MKLKSILILFILFFLYFNTSKAQAPSKPSSGEIYNKILQLQKVGTVMYLAAHPDDENTRLITWLSNKQHVNTVYLSLTRGGGGQNLIGTETGEMLGILRTEELLMARGVDGGKQWFSRAVDFGFSKKAKETLEIWDKNQVLSDVVSAIRYWQPDIIINRFPADTSVATHGHHTASAILSAEAFDKVNDPNAFPESALKYGQWQPTRTYFNTSYFFYKSQAEFDKANKSNLANIEIGDYYPILGKSNNEIAALSRSMHKCQSFGSIGNRKELTEYLEFLKGTPTKNKDDIFEGIDMTWNRLPGGKDVNGMIQGVLDKYSFEDPSLSIPSLVKLYQYISSTVQNSRKKDQKLTDLKEIIGYCAGLYAEILSSEPVANRSSSLKFNIELTNRSKEVLNLKRIKIVPMFYDTIMSNMSIKMDENYFKTIEIKIHDNEAFTGPYWVEKAPSNGLYTVSNKDWIGMPETPRDIQAVFTVEIEGVNFDFNRTVVYKMEDPIKGEVYTPFDIVPDVVIQPSDEVILFKDNAPKTISVKLIAQKDSIRGTIALAMNRMWGSIDNVKTFSMKHKGEEQNLVFTIQPPQVFAETEISFIAKIGDKSFNQSLYTIHYDHIPEQRVIKPATMRLVREDIKCPSVKIAYIFGPGDKIPEAIKQIGMSVTVLKPDEINFDNLVKYDVLITGIRAYNKVNELATKRDDIMKFVENGGTLISQYNTNYDLVTKEIGPYPFTITRGRVTNENAPMIILDPKNQLVNYPNKIEERDFEGWVQERGLYFLTTEDTHYQKLFKSNDPGENYLDGSLLFTPYGKGNYVYCALSLFRQLPAGVPGAFKLMANMLALGSKTSSTK